MADCLGSLLLPARSGKRGSGQSFVRARLHGTSAEAASVQSGGADPSDGIGRPFEQHPSQLATAQLTARWPEINRAAEVVTSARVRGLIEQGGGNPCR